MTELVRQGPDTEVRDDLEEEVTYKLRSALWEGRASGRAGPQQCKGPGTRVGLTCLENRKIRFLHLGKIWLVKIPISLGLL